MFNGEDPLLANVCKLLIVITAFGMLVWLLVIGLGYYWDSSEYPTDFIGNPCALKDEKCFKDLENLWQTNG